jgi:hypothetical protein
MTDYTNTYPDLANVEDWLNAKGYTGEAGLCTKAMDEINRLREALKFYADDDNWQLNGPLDANSGNFTGGPATAALKEKGK